MNNKNIYLISKKQWNDFVQQVGGANLVVAYLTKHVNFYYNAFIYFFFLLLIFIQFRIYSFIYFLLNKVYSFVIVRIITIINNFSDNVKLN